jgi:hypothetical protein
MIALHFGGFPYPVDYVEIEASGSSGQVLMNSVLESIVPFQVTVEESFAGLLTFGMGRLSPDLAVTDATLMSAYFGRNTRAIAFAGMVTDPVTTTDQAAASAVFSDTGDGVLGTLPIGAATSYGGFLVLPLPTFAGDIQSRLDAGASLYQLGYRITEKWIAPDMGFHYFQSAMLRVSYHEPVTVDVDPDTMNVRSRGKYVTAYVEIWPGCDPADIDLSTVSLNGVPAVTGKGFADSVGDHDRDGVPDRTLKFDRGAVLETLEENVPLRLDGALLDGSPFRGSDVNRVLR